ncbi:MAG: FIST N-terminal domain-containing protein, partial [Kofleriaceae bacterium]
GDGLAVNGVEFARGIGKTVGNSVVVTGGLSADMLAKRSWLTVGGALKQGIAAAVGFYGPNVVIGYGVSGDWNTLDPSWTITRCEGNVVYELGGQPALAAYRQALEDRADELPEVAVWYPLSVRDGAGAATVRTVIAIDEATSTLILGGDVAVGQTARLLNADLENLIEGGGRAASMATKTGAPVSVDCLALAVSCFGRRAILGSWSNEEIQAMRDGLHAQRTSVTGFYAYAQFSPADGVGPTVLHNQTLGLTVFSEGRSSEVAAPRAARAAPPTVPGAYAVRSLSYDLKTEKWSSPLPDLDSAKTLVIAFGAPELIDNRRPYDELVEKYPRSIIVGCSTAGEIHQAGVADRTLTVAITRFAKTTLKVATETLDDPARSQEVGRRLATALSQDPTLRGVLLLSEGLNVNGTELLNGINGVFNGSVSVSGGLAGDGSAFKRTWVAAGPMMASNTIVAIGFCGNHVVIGHGSRGGWDRFGPKRTVTRSDGNVLYELDRRPALQIYKEYLGDRATDLPASGLSLPLAIRDPSTDTSPVVRTLLAIDHEAGSLTFAGNIPAGHVAQFMKADYERLINGATHAALMAAEIGAPAAAESLVIAISDAGRRQALGARTEEEIEAIGETFRSDRARVSGFYAYAEICPGQDGRAELHNQAMTLMVVSESLTPVLRPEPPRKPPAQQRPADPVVPAVAVAPKEPARSGHDTLAPTVSDKPVPKEISQVPVPAAAVAETIPLAPITPRGAIVRIPTSITSDAAVEETAAGELRVVRVRGRVTEAFKGEIAARLLTGRVILDLGDVHRITSFGVREWLAMFAAATDLTDCYMARCSESVVNQLTMIRKFDGGSRILSFFAPYLCDECGKNFERLLDCDDDAQEISGATPQPVRCPRCGGQGRFDDDPRSYFSFVGAHALTPLPPDVRAMHEKISSQDQVRPAEDVEKIVEGDVTRVRIHGKLTLHIRWRRVLDDIDGSLIVDLSAVTSIEVNGVMSLDFAIRGLPPKNHPILIEHAPAALLDRLVLRPAPEIIVVSAAVGAYCHTCAVARTAVVRIDQYIAAQRSGASYSSPCKRCDSKLELKFEAAFLQYVASNMPPPAPRSASPTRPPTIDPYTPPASVDVAPPPVAPADTAVTPVPPAPARSLRNMVPTAVAVGVVGIAAISIAMFSGGDTPSEPPRGGAPYDVVDGPATPVDAAPPSRWIEVGDALLPPWAELPFSIQNNMVYVVGTSEAASQQEAISLARRNATRRMLVQVYGDMEPGPVRDFLKGRMRDDEGVITGSVHRFLGQFGETSSLRRSEESKYVLIRPSGHRLKSNVRFELQRSTYTALVRAYTETATFRGVTVARYFPLLYGTIAGTAELVVVDVAQGSAAANQGILVGDLISMVGRKRVESLAAFRREIASPPANVELGVETQGVPRRVTLGRKR